MNEERISTEEDMDAFIEEVLNNVEQGKKIKIYVHDKKTKELLKPILPEEFTMRVNKRVEPGQVRVDMVD